MDRRKFIRYGLIGGGSILSGWVVWRLSKDREQIVVEVLQEALDYLQIDPAEMRRFAHDVLQQAQWSWGKLQAYNWLRLIRKDPRNTAAFLSQAFLLSSDFFLKGANEQQPVQYLGLYDPYRTPCRNPFWQRLITGDPTSG